jgi:hypothetical protein
VRARADTLCTGQPALGGGRGARTGGDRVQGGALGELEARLVEREAHARVDASAPQLRLLAAEDEVARERKHVAQPHRAAQALALERRGARRAREPARDLERERDAHRRARVRAALDARARVRDEVRHLEQHERAHRVRVRGDAQAPAGVEQRGVRGARERAARGARVRAAHGGPPAVPRGERAHRVEQVRGHALLRERDVEVRAVEHQPVRVRVGEEDCGGRAAQGDRGAAGGAAEGPGADRKRCAAGSKGGEARGQRGPRTRWTIGARFTSSCTSSGWSSGASSASAQTTLSTGGSSAGAGAGAGRASSTGSLSDRARFRLEDATAWGASPLVSAGRAAGRAGRGAETARPAALVYTHSLSAK